VEKQMTIVDLSSLDTFIRDSLYEVRKGIANSRNATQTNPMLGVMVDLPDKIDFEIMVSTNYQALNRIVSTTETQGTSESEGNKSISIEAESSQEVQHDENKGVSNSLSQNINNDLKTDTDSQYISSSGNESNTSFYSENEHRAGSGVELDVKTGQGIEQSMSSGTTTEMGTTESQGTITETDESQGTKDDSSSSVQGEIHLEANDRASKTFDEDEGEWGQQGQVSTPKLPGNPCNC
jgi:hypothetical protein